MELWDAYTADGTPTGEILVRGEPIPAGRYHLVSEVLIRHRDGGWLVMRRDPGKDYCPGFWEASAGGSALAGEDSLTAIVRELYEETGIQASPEEFELLDACTDRSTHYDHYCLHRDSSKVKVVLQPGETDGAQWATFAQIHEMIRTRQICKVIGKQFLHHEPLLLARQTAQE